MIDPRVRKLLSQDVRRLITGRMTNDEFDDVYYASYDPSEDRAVAAIASSCYCLYSSDLLFPYRLRGQYAVDDATRTTAARCVLFLRSGREYEWPPTPDSPAIRMLAGLALFFGIPAGIALLLICILLALSGDGLAAPTALLGVLLLAGSTSLVFSWPNVKSAEWQAFRESGDYEVWPFLERKDFDQARRTSHMFAK